MERSVHLKQLRENVNHYIKQVKNGAEFVVYRHSEAVFRILPPEDAQWQSVIDFTIFKKGGVHIEDLLKRI